MSSEKKNNNTIYQNIHQDIINRCISGDQKAQFQLYKLYYRAMYNTSLRIVNDTMEAEDIMQESFLSAFDKMDTYEGKVSFGAWLKRIVINNSLDSLKRKKVDFESIDEYPVDLTEERNDQLETDKYNFNIEEIREALPLLPEKYRVVFSLYLLEGYDHEEIAGILGISSSTSRSQLVRAKQKLLKILSENQ
ncbi:MAG: RNA polymerase sigma factor [Bacteroidales bacterium]|nr:MAG: RNA polymerase sigma factor [Bacteroidales bacterium]